MKSDLPLKILLVENHDDTRVYLSRYLEMSGHTVMAAGTMEDALATLKSHGATDVLISDIGLPDGNGWDLMRRVGEMNTSTFGIAMSGFGAQADREKSAQAGYKHHLVKPFLPDELDRILAQVVKN